MEIDIETFTTLDICLNDERRTHIIDNKDIRSVIIDMDKSEIEYTLNESDSMELDFLDSDKMTPYVLNKLIIMLPHELRDSTITMMSHTKTVKEAISCQGSGTIRLFNLFNDIMNDTSGNIIISNLDAQLHTAYTTHIIDILMNNFNKKQFYISVQRNYAYSFNENEINDVCGDANE